MDFLDSCNENIVDTSSVRDTRVGQHVHDNFPQAENPISQGGQWLNGGLTGLDWSNVATTPSRAFGTETAQSRNYADSTAILTGTWGATQTAQATVFIAATNTTTFQEVELRLHSAISAHSCTGYEVLFSVNPVDPYVQIVRWNGAFGSFTLLDARVSPVVHNGDTVKATINGNTITAYINNNVVFSATDATYHTGNPGIGFYLQYHNNPVATASNYGFSSFTVTDGLGSSPTPSPTFTPTPTPRPSATPTATATATPTPTATASGTTYNVSGTITLRPHASPSQQYDVIGGTLNLVPFP